MVHCLVSTFKYLLKDNEARAALRRMSEALRSGGLCVIGLHLTDYSSKLTDYEKWVNQRGSVKVLSETWSVPARRKERRESMHTRMTIIEGGKTRIEETDWEFRTYSAKELKALLAKVNSLELVGCHDFRYNIKNKRRLDDAYADIVLVLRKK